MLRFLRCQRRTCSRRARSRPRLRCERRSQSTRRVQPHEAKRARRIPDQPADGHRRIHRGRPPGPHAEAPRRESGFERALISAGQTFCGRSQLERPLVRVHSETTFAPLESSYTEVGAGWRKNDGSEVRRILLRSLTTGKAQAMALAFLLAASAFLSWPLAAQQSEPQPPPSSEATPPKAIVPAPAPGGISTAPPSIPVDQVIQQLRRAKPSSKPSATISPTFRLSWCKRSMTMGGRTANIA